MKTITVIIEFADNNLAAYVEEVAGVVVTAKSITEVKKSIKEALDLLVETCVELGDEVPEQLQGEYEIIYKYDTASFLSLYSKVLPKSGLEQLTGVNQKLLWHYASGRRKPKAATKEKIAEAIREFGRELANVQFA
jgi:predicted RNase H-like HicB family nuclease